MRRLNRPITAQKLRLRITGSQATPCISEFSLFRQPAGAVRPSIFRRGDNLIILADGKNKILYTTDGSEPKEGSPVYSQGAKFAESGTVKARCQFSNGKLGPVSQAKFGISKSTVHKDISERLPLFNRALYLQVKEVLDVNKAQRHIRGGIATRKKYKGT